MDGQIRILILEDETADFELIRRELRKASLDFTLEWTRDKASFLAAMESFCPDLVLADYSLPGFDGLSAISMVQERYHQTPVIIVSGAIGEERAIDVLKAGATDYVLKQRLERLGPVVHRALQEARQIAERQLAEQALHQSEERFRAIIEGVQDYAIYMLDPQGIIVSWNAGAERIKGWSADEVLGQHFSIFYSEQARANGEPERRLQQVAATGSFSEQAQRLRKDGKVFWADITITALKDETGRLSGFAKITRDITERKQLEQEQQKANELLEQRVQERTAELSQSAQELQAANQSLEMAQEKLRIQNQELETALEVEKNLRSQLIQIEKYAALARLVGSVAHEINNPLQTVQNSLYLLRQDLPDGQGQDILKMAVSECGRMGSLVQQLKETYRPSNPQQVDFELLDVLTKVQTLLAARLRQDNIVWQLKSDVESVPVYGLPDQIQQVCLNICLNAIDAMTPKGGKINVSVTLPPRSRRACLAFQDTGPGIPEDHLDRIFEPFFTTKPKGTGLGLAICYEIVKDHGGEITVESRVGEGTAFRVWLPVKAEDG